MVMERISANMIDEAFVNQFRDDKLMAIGAVETGFVDLDHMLGGLKRGETYLLGGRPGMGKTAFAMNLIEQIAVERNHSVAIFSLDREREYYINSMIQLVSKVERRLYRKSFERQVEKEVNIGKTRLEKARLYIVDTPGLNATEMQQQLEKVEEPLDLIIVDYLQIMGSDIDDSPSVALVNALKFKQIAKKMNCPVIILSQISDAPDRREQHRPTVADLLETGMEGCVDYIFLLYRDEYYNKRTDMRNIAEIIIAKNKLGDNGTVLLCWMPEYNRICSLDEEFDM